MIEKILLDTDIGSDIDDAVCLAYLLMHPECDLLGVTTVSGESIKRAMMVSAICKVAGRDIPIFPGVQKPLLAAQRQPKAQQAVRLSDWPHQRAFPNFSAISFLADQIMSSPGEVTLLAIGPLTNIALLFSVYPETISALKQLVLMCGVFTNDPDNPWKAEWNALLDPHATDIVYRAPVPVHKSVGLDVTRKVRLAHNEVESRLTHSLLQPVLDFSGVWFEEQSWMYFHDPLAAVSIFEPAICNFSPGTVQVTSDLSADLPGKTDFRAGDETAPHQVALEVNVNNFFEAYFSVFN